MEVLAVGPSALLVGVDSAADAVSLALHLRAAEVAVEVVPGARTVLLDQVRTSRAWLEESLASWVPSVPDDGPVVEVPVVFDGEDLSSVASAWDCAPDDVVDRLTSVELVSAFCGFAPGFAYLAGMSSTGAPLVPRLPSPRPRVPAGSVALAGEWVGVYPTASPGGWRLVGRTSVTLWVVDRDPPALLAPGVRVRFVEV